MMDQTGQSVFIRIVVVVVSVHSCVIPSSHSKCHRMGRCTDRTRTEAVLQLDMERERANKHTQSTGVGGQSQREIIVKNRR